MTQKQPSSNPQLPIGNAAIYKRSAAVDSTKDQNPTPPHELIQLARVRGFDDTHIVVFEDNGVSANTPMTERVGLSSLIHAIENGTIQAIFLEDENRLFRDVFAVQLNSFIELCEEHNTCVITPDATYDFTNPYDVKLFRFQYEEVYQYAYQVLIGRLQTGRRTAARRRKANQ